MARKVSARISPKKIKQLSSLYLNFKKGEPKNIVMYWTFNLLLKGIFETYKDFGWEFCGQMATHIYGEWNIWESFTDIQQRKISVFLKQHHFLYFIIVDFLIIAVSLQI